MSAMHGPAPFLASPLRPRGRGPCGWASRRGQQVPNGTAGLCAFTLGQEPDVTFTWPWGTAERGGQASEHFILFTGDPVTAGPTPPPAPPVPTTARLSPPTSRQPSGAKPASKGPAGGLVTGMRDKSRPATGWLPELQPGSTGLSKFLAPHPLSSGFLRLLLPCYPLVSATEGLGSPAPRRRPVEEENCSGIQMPATPVQPPPTALTPRDDGGRPGPPRAPRPRDGLGLLAHPVPKTPWASSRTPSPGRPGPPRAPRPRDALVLLAHPVPKTPWSSSLTPSPGRPGPPRAPRPRDGLGLLAHPVPGTAWASSRTPSPGRPGPPRAPRPRDGLGLLAHPVPKTPWSSSRTPSPGRPGPPRAPRPRDGLGLLAHPVPGTAWASSLTPSPGRPGPPRAPRPRDGLGLLAHPVPGTAWSSSRTPSPGRPGPPRAPRPRDGLVLLAHPGIGLPSVRTLHFQCSGLTIVTRAVIDWGRLCRRQVRERTLRVVSHEVTPSQEFPPTRTAVVTETAGGEDQGVEKPSSSRSAAAGRVRRTQQGDGHLRRPSTNQEDDPHHARITWRLDLELPGLQRLLHGCVWLVAARLDSEVTGALTAPRGWEAELPQAGGTGAHGHRGVWPAADNCEGLRGPTAAAVAGGARPAHSDELGWKRGHGEARLRDREAGWELAGFRGPLGRRDKNRERSSVEGPGKPAGGGGRCPPGSQPATLSQPERLSAPGCQRAARGHGGAAGAGPPDRPQQQSRAGCAWRGPTRRTTAAVPSGVRLARAHPTDHSSSPERGAAGAGPPDGPQQQSRAGCGWRGPTRRTTAAVPSGVRLARAHPTDHSSSPERGAPGAGPPDGPQQQSRAGCAWRRPTRQTTAAVPSGVRLGPSRLEKHVVLIVSSEDIKTPG
ncbi:collagen alpha-1(III) chain-like [Saccopteryx leptura]|uniref:collagen alpha-1(III) chain-like n=1 Tax=Saccopteryx leptura TaxID=249018 RepID=UPI00339D0470